MLKYFKKGCEYNWSDGCFAAGMKLRYHSDLITNDKERTQNLLQVTLMNKYLTEN